MKCNFHRKCYKYYHCALSDSRLCCTSSQILANRLGYIEVYSFPYQKEEYEMTEWDNDVSPATIFNNSYEYLYTQTTEELTLETYQKDIIATPPRWSDPEWNDDSKWKKMEIVNLPSTEQELKLDDNQLLDEYYGDEDYEGEYNGEVIVEVVVGDINNESILNSPPVPSTDLNPQQTTN